MILFDLRLNKRLSKHSETGDLRRYRAHYYVIVMNNRYGVFQMRFVHPANSKHKLPQQLLLAQIPQCTNSMSHNTPFCNRNINVFTILLQNGALCDILCIMGLVICVQGAWAV